RRRACRSVRSTPGEPFAVGARPCRRRRPGVAPVDRAEYADVDERPQGGDEDVRHPVMDDLTVAAADRRLERGRSGLNEGRSTVGGPPERDALIGRVQTAWD